MTLPQLIRFFIIDCLMVTPLCIFTETADSVKYKGLQRVSAQFLIDNNRWRHQRVACLPVMPSPVKAKAVSREPENKALFPYHRDHARIVLNLNCVKLFNTCREPPYAYPSLPVMSVHLFQIQTNILYWNVDQIFTLFRYLKLQFSKCQSRHFYGH